MKKLSGLDAAFYHQDTERTPMHVTAVLTYGSNDKTGLAVEQLGPLLQRAGDHFPFLNHKLRDYSMGMDEPVLVRDKHFAARHHIETIRLPAPGSWQQLMSNIGRIHSTRLPRNRPLWQACLVTGIDDADKLPSVNTALVFRVHHAVLDGMSLRRFLLFLHGDNAAEKIQTPPTEEEQPDFYKAWQQSSTRSWQRPMQLVKTVARIIPKLNSRKEEKDKGDAMTVAKSLFNQPVCGNKVVGALQIPMIDYRALKRRVKGVTGNDIALAIVAGAMREYLTLNGQLPTTGLRASVPINLRNHDDVKDGNNISMMLVNLASNIESPRERLSAIHQNALAAKKKTSELGERTLMEVSDSLSPFALAESLRMLSFATIAADLPVPSHTLVSNVPGPLRPQSLCGFPLQSIFGFGPTRDNMGLFHIVTNTEQHISIAFASSRKIMQDAEQYEACLQASYDALRVACEAN